MAGAVETVDIGGNLYNVYGLGNADPVQDADDYFAARLGASAWTLSTTKEQALVSAVRYMTRAARFSGTKTVSTQDTAWPRDGASCSGSIVADGTIPDNVVHGSFELALALLQDEAIQATAGTGSNIKRAKAGSAEVEFFSPTVGKAGQDSRFPTIVQDLIGCYTTGSNASFGLYVNGTDADCIDERSAFDSASDGYGLSGPL